VSVCREVIGLAFPKPAGRGTELNSTDNIFVNELLILNV
jgi:hypothetical protein